MSRFGRRGAALLAVIAVGLSSLVGLSGPAAAAGQARHGVATAVVTAAPAASSREFLDAVEKVMPSLHRKYSDSQLVKIAKTMCTSLKQGATIKQVDGVLRQHVSKSEAMVIASLGAAAFCPAYYEKARKYYHIPA